MMKKNLIFKRMNNGITEMKVIPVEFDDTLIKEGFQLVSWCDTIEIREHLPKVQEQKPEAPEIKLVQLGDKFESRVHGTARLIRTAKKIKIAFRRGKSTLNQTAPDSICIDDVTKNWFFNDVKTLFGGDPDEWAIPVSYSAFAKWTKFMDEEYIRQVEAVNHARKTGI